MEQKTEENKKAIQNRVYYQVIEYIKSLVEERQIKFGGKLPSEREMMENLGLSRNSIREALRTLEHMGLVESRQGKGNFLVDRMGESLSSVFSMLIFMKESNYLEVSHLRRAMEAQAFDLVLEKWNEEDKKNFGEIMARIKKSDYESMVQADHDFHRMLIVSSGNHLLEMLMNALSQVCQEEITMILEVTARDNKEWWYEMHNKIYQCLVNGQRDAGIAAIDEHYNWIDDKLKIIECGTII